MLRLNCEEKTSKSSSCKNKYNLNKCVSIKRSCQLEKKAKEDNIF